MGLAALIGVLGVWNNAVAPRLSRRRGGYEVGNAAAALALLGAARAAGLSIRELGLDRRYLTAGLRTGGPVAAAVVAGLATAVAVPGLRPLLRDTRTAGLEGRAVAYRVLVRIPVGTVLWEEFAFRGVLQAALARSLPPGRAAVAGAALFGVWHVAPSLAALRANRLAPTPLAVAVACAGTGASGLLFGELRRRSGSLLAPALLHLAANCGGLLAAVAAQASSGRPV